MTKDHRCTLVCRVPVKTVVTEAYISSTAYNGNDMLYGNSNKFNVVNKLLREQLRVYHTFSKCLTAAVYYCTLYYIGIHYSWT